MAAEAPHILIVDDDKDIRKTLADYLARHGFRTRTAADGQEMDRMLAGASVDLVILDVMLPGEDGLSICRRLQQTHKAPLILLSAMVEGTDRIVGLECGADDYVTKPFIPRELLARVKAVLRRAAMLPRRQQRPRGVAVFEGWRFDLARHELVGPDQVVVRLSTSEHRLLSALVENAGLTLSRDQLLDLTRGRDAQLFDRSIDNQVSRLRRKIEPDARNPRIIVTQRGGGYGLGVELDWVS
jgi:two-component system OmpR family response regulator